MNDSEARAAIEGRQPRRPDPRPALLRVARRGIRRASGRGGMGVASCALGADLAFVERHTPPRAQHRRPCCERTGKRIY